MLHFPLQNTERTIILYNKGIAIAVKKPMVFAVESLTVIMIPMRLFAEIAPCSDSHGTLTLA